MKSKFIILELIFYMAAPYLIWTYGREYLGDYYAMLLSTLPAIIYTLYRFFIDKQFNIVGLFIISSMALSTIVDLLSGSALQMLWNSVWLGYAFTFVHIVSMLIKKPFALYFAVDISYFQGYPRENSKKLFYLNGNVKYFQLVNAIMVIRGLVMNSIQACLILNYGVDAFMHLIFIRKALSIVFGGLIFIAFGFAMKKCSESINNQNIDWPVPIHATK
ncbi:VC0807 family protein [Psychrobacillus vulpis]|uniref:DUF3159 domain-containing protein n=1 Tax=Psychrobacillus vulpis TaxID=2325572 RepID=A0A544TT21_9BACI|nr:VC0807 family protein [Psychrobacillus vulpis]TQR20602.1 hypothetical protein FG384_05755 [Psychrobacillus vulpis]